jgi:hypothetical protein
LGSSAEDTNRIIRGYTEEARAIEKQLIHITFYMRGGINLDQARRLTPYQRKWALEFIEENIERTNKSGVMFH